MARAEQVLPTKPHWRALFLSPDLSSAAQAGTHHTWWYFFKMLCISATSSLDTVLMTKRRS